MKRTRTGLGSRLLSSAHPLFLTAVLALGGLPSCSNGSDPAPGGDGGSNGTSTGGKSGSGGSGGSKGGSGGSGSGGSSASGGSSGSGGASGGSSGSGGAGTDASAGGGSTGTGGSSPGVGGSDGGSPSETGAPDMGTSGMMITGDGCAGGTCLNKDCMPYKMPAAAIGSFPELEFGVSEYIPPDVVIPTFDDVPDRPYTQAADPKKFELFQDGDWTNKMLDFFEQKNLHMDFFINSNNFCDVEKTPSCQAVIKRILKSHNAGNHSIHHVHFGFMGPRNDTPDTFDCDLPGSKYKCADELKGVETTISMLSGGGVDHLTRFRLPYGQPLYPTPESTAGAIKNVASKFAIHVGWAMDSQDSNHDEDGNQLGAAFFAQQVNAELGGGPGKGKHGLILMHGTYPWSLGEIKILLDPANPKSFQAQKFRLGTVEDAVCWKYGKHSWEIIESLTKAPHGPN
jgi:peptidoglycan/xylan/chitin deacetylase (PgdA/CDA1 family)